MVLQRPVRVVSRCTGFIGFRARVKTERINMVPADLTPHSRAPGCKGLGHFNARSTFEAFEKSEALSR